MTKNLRFLAVSSLLGVIAMTSGCIVVPLDDVGYYGGHRHHGDRGRYGDDRGGNYGHRGRGHRDGRDRGDDDGYDRRGR